MRLRVNSGEKVKICFAKKGVEGKIMEQHKRSIRKESVVKKAKAKFENFQQKRKFCSWNKWS